MNMQAFFELTTHVFLPKRVLLKLCINNLSGLRHYLMNGLVAEAQWESTFPT